MDNRWRPLALLLAVAAMAAAGAPCVAQPQPSYVQPPPAPPAATPVTPSAGVPWANLSPEQQRLLSNFGGQWNALPPERHA